MVRDYQEITRLLKAIRIEKGYTNNAVAKKIGIDPATYNKRENNPQIITIDFLSVIAKALDVEEERIKNIFFAN